MADGSGFVTEQDPMLLLDEPPRPLCWADMAKVCRWMGDQGYVFLGKGATRWVYAHPMSPGWVVKVEVAEGDGSSFNEHEHEVAQSGRIPAPRTALERLSNGMVLLHMERVVPFYDADQACAVDWLVECAQRLGWAHTWAWDAGLQFGRTVDGRLVCYDLGYA